MKVDNIPVVILCGGRGTRLREKTVNTPKPLIEIGGKPMVWHIMEIYKNQGFSNFILACGYKVRQFRQFAKKQKNGVQVIDTGEDTRKGGRIFLLKEYLKTPLFMCTYGDGVSDINLKKLLLFHKRKDKVATITCVQPRNQYGIVNIENGLIKSFVEKPRMKEWVNGGFFVFKSSFFNYLSENCGLEDVVLPRLAKDGQVAAYKHSGFWASMDTYQDFQELNKIWYDGKPLWKI
jgi:glucose-1-phosphate cytidylyltransferase